MAHLPWRGSHFSLMMLLFVSSILVQTFASNDQDKDGEQDELQEILNRLGSLRTHSKHTQKTDQNPEADERGGNDPIPNPNQIEGRTNELTADRSNEPIPNPNARQDELADQEIEDDGRRGEELFPADGNFPPADRADIDAGEQADKDSIPADFLAEERQGPDQGLVTDGREEDNEGYNPPPAERSNEADEREGQPIPHIPSKRTDGSADEDAEAGKQDDDGNGQRDGAPPAERTDEDIQTDFRENEGSESADDSAADNEGTADQDGQGGQREDGDPPEADDKPASRQSIYVTSSCFYWVYKPHYYPYGSMSTAAYSLTSCRSQCINKPFCDGVSWTYPYCLMSGPWSTSLNPYNGRYYWALVRRCSSAYHALPILVQRRYTTASYFNQYWSTFSKGFGGTTYSYYWIGNNLLSQLTYGYRYKLRFNLRNRYSRWYYADYSYVYVSSESSSYRLSLGSYSGNAGNAMSYHNGQRFSTRDRDYDVYSYGNCASIFSGGWWHRSCYRVGINAGKTPSSYYFKWDYLPGGSSLSASEAWLVPRYCKSILVHQRYGYTTYFNRNWAAFKYGFGSTSGNYWIGNAALNKLTYSRNYYKLYIELQSLSTSRWYYAKYSYVRVTSEASGYRLYLGSYSGTAGYDALRYVNGYRFTTYDRDYDGWSSGNCASRFVGGFWHRSCYYTSLTSSKTPNQYYYKWHGLPGGYSLKASRIWLTC